MVKSRSELEIPTLIERERVVRLSTPSRMRLDPFDVLWPMTSNLSRLDIGTKPNPNRLIR